MCLCRIQAHWSLQQSADLTERGLEVAGPACSQVRGQGRWGGGRGQVASEGGSTHLPVRLCWAGHLEACCPSTLMAWGELWRWNFSCTVNNKKSAAFTPKAFMVQKDLVLTFSAGWTSTLQERKTFNRGEHALTGVNLPRVRLSNMLHFLKSFWLSPQSPTLTLEEGKLCLALSPPTAARMMPRCLWCCSTARAHPAGLLPPYYILKHVFNVYRSFCPHLHYNFVAYHKCKMSFTSSTYAFLFIAFT